MIVVSAILAFFILLLFLRFGVYAEYAGGGLTVAAQVGPMRIKVYPFRKVKPEKAKKRAARKAKIAERKRKKKFKSKKPVGIEGINKMLPAVRTVISRFRRRLLIKELTIHYTSAGDDPSKTATSYGAASALFGALVPLLENNFRIKRRDLRAFTDFQARKPDIYAKAAASIAIWEAVYIITPFIGIIGILTGSKV